MADAWDRSALVDFLNRSKKLEEDMDRFYNRVLRGCSRDNSPFPRMLSDQNMVSRNLSLLIDVLDGNA